MPQPKKLIPKTPQQLSNSAASRRRRRILIKQDGEWPRTHFEFIHPALMKTFS